VKDARWSCHCRVALQHECAEHQRHSQTTSRQVIWLGSSAGALSGVTPRAVLPLSTPNQNIALCTSVPRTVSSPPHRPEAGMVVIMNAQS